ncbi:hypothetical protein KIN20_038202 [Parelaphostrongylus tenuis]|uniref:Uncharacterized protein n=1 Tax=Parelaphostrongylus tenuis TaxID=148309 RepID=A0AAD5REJ8_PARTN|nr:hypothetical protein KIN20_038202 [Parelaphostrongylus tenuis]
MVRCDRTDFIKVHTSVPPTVDARCWIGCAPSSQNMAVLPSQQDTVPMYILENLYFMTQWDIVQDVDIVKLLTM